MEIRAFDPYEKLPEEATQPEHDKLEAISNSLKQLLNPELTSEQKGTLKSEVLRNKELLDAAFKNDNAVERWNFISNTLWLAFKKEMPEEVQKLGLSLIEQNVPSLEKMMKTDLFGAPLAFSSLRVLIERNADDQGNKQQFELGLSVLERNAETIKSLLEHFREHGSSSLLLDPLNTLLTYGNEGQKLKAEKILEGEIFDSENQVARSFEILDWAFRSKNDRMRKVAERVIERELSQYGLDSELFIKKWRLSMSANMRAWNVAGSNLYKIMEVEKVHDGAIKILNKEFGIFDFGRYPVELLIRQYEQRDNVEIPYGIVIGPQNDYNEAFYVHSPHVYKHLLKQLAGRYEIRVMEAADKIDVVKYLSKFNRRYGKQQKISFGIIGGHGTTESIKFGAEQPKDVLKLEDLTDPRAPKMGRYFKDNATLILFSCSTGKGEKNIAAKISEVGGKTVIAPNQDRAISDITASITEEGINFQVQYEKVSGESVEARTFAPQS